MAEDGPVPAKTSTAPLSHVDDPNLGWNDGITSEGKRGLLVWQR